MDYSAKVVEDNMVIDYERLSAEISLDFLDENGWECELSPNGKVTEIHWDSSSNFYPDDMMAFFHKIRTYVKDGSYIYFCGEEVGDRWGFFFENGTVKCETLHLVRDSEYELLQKIKKKE